MAGNDYAQNTTLRSPLGRVRGLGSAKGGTHHWWMQRVTSAALLPLTLWFAISAAGLAGAPYEVTRDWIAHPLNAVLLLAAIGLSFHHTAAGVQVIIEDYANQEWVKVGGFRAARSIFWLVGIASALAVLRIAVWGGPMPGGPTGPRGPVGPPHAWGAEVETDDERDQHAQPGRLPDR